VTVDVLLPYYGDVAMMKQAVESVLGQTSSDWTLTIIDDGYPDQSLPDYFGTLAARDPRITYVHNEHNLGANGTSWLNTYTRSLIQPPVAQTLAAPGAVTINTPTTGYAEITLQANATSSVISGGQVNGAVLTITWIQDATGGRTYVWPTNCKFAGGVAPSDTTLSKRTSVTFHYDSTSTNWTELSRAVAVG